MAGYNVKVITEHGGHRLLIGTDGTHVETPPLEYLGFYIGLGALVAVDLVEWPLALVVTVGHLLVEATSRPGLRALGEGLEA